MSLFLAFAKESGAPKQPLKCANWVQNRSFSVVDVTEPPEKPPETGLAKAAEPKKCNQKKKPKWRKFKPVEEENHEKKGFVKTDGQNKLSSVKTESAKAAESKACNKVKKQKAEEVKPTGKGKNFQKECFFIDTKGTKEYLSFKTINRPSAPRYYVKYYMTKSQKRHKPKKFKRYYHWSHVAEDKNEEKVITKKNLDKLVESKKDENFAGFKQEENLAQTTANYNKKLAENPHDIKMWLTYVNFQDIVYQFEKTYRKGSIAKGLRVLTERKLSILDKALSHNLHCEELIRARLNVCVSIYPSDELQVQLKNLVDKDQGNIILWQGYIESIQCSMSHCNTPSVLDLYTKCLSILHKLRRNSSMEKSQLEENILKMLYQCGLFLKQAGRFEQLWTLLRLYLELNLSSSDKNKFNIASGFDEKELVELEEIVLKSQLPLHELWLRTEKLREACHWLPYMEERECEDPQRLVFPGDVAELIHPITMPENTFKLIATIMTLIKVPLLYCRHTTMQDLGLDYVPWALDSIESLISIFLPLYPIDLSNKNLIIDSKLAVGPQYLKVLPGQEEYLNFILTTMKSCTECLNNDDKVAMTIWWLRFQKLLIVLEKQGRFKLPQAFTKKIKSNVKTLLKQEENRSNTIFYCEYALIEYELGDSETCLKILQTALYFNRNKKILVNFSNEQTARCYLNRTLIEVYLNLGKNSDALKHLIGYVFEKSGPVDTITDDVLNQTALKLKHVTSQLLQNEIEKLPVANQFLPNFFTDWIICNGWFLYLTKSAIQCGTFLEDILSELDKKNPGMLWQKEVLFEFYVAVFVKHCVSNPGRGDFKILDDLLNRAVELYPNNIFLLTVLAKTHSMSSCSGPRWWNLKTLLLKTGRAFPILFLVLIANQQMLESQESYVDPFTERTIESSDSHKNRILALFKRITEPEMCTRRCGLVWRLYLQFVFAYFDPTLCRNVYFSAVEECPWLKSLYIDAAIYIPAELAQIQDLLIEKELRLHVTPEELDVLRS